MAAFSKTSSMLTVALVTLLLAGAKSDSDTCECYKYAQAYTYDENIDKLRDEDPNLNNGTACSAPPIRRRRNTNETVGDFGVDDAAKLKIGPNEDAQAKCTKPWSGSQFDEDDKYFTGGNSACLDLCAYCGCGGYEYENNQDDCFPASAQIEFENGTFAAMSDVQVGDMVRVGPAAFEHVFAFTHKDHTAKREFIKLSLGDRSLTVSPGHYVYINGSLVAARLAKPCDIVDTVTGPAKITAVGTEDTVGLFNPHTASGAIFVNGVKASCYTEAVSPTLAHSIMHPLGKLYSYGIGTNAAKAWTSMHNGGGKIAEMVQAFGLAGKPKY